MFPPKSKMCAIRRLDQAQRSSGKGSLSGIWAALGRAHVAVSLFLFCSAGIVLADDPPLPGQLEGVGVEERTGETLPVHLQFRTHDNRSVRLRQIISNRPAILSLNYSRCPLLCQLQLQGLVDTLRQIDLSPGSDFDVVSISIDPLETVEQSALARKKHLQAYGVAGAGDGWHFLTGTRENIRSIADAVGFQYRYLPDQREYAHAAVFAVITPDARISHYFYGVQYDPTSVRLALIESSQGKLGSAFDQLLLFCFHYDAEAGRYGPVAKNIMSTGGLLTVAVLTLWLVPAWVRRKSQQRNAPRSTRGSREQKRTVSATQVMSPGFFVSAVSSWFPESASSVAGDVDWLFGMILAICTAFFLLIVGLLVYFVIRYRRTAERRMGSGPSHHTGLEIAWSVIPFLILILIFGYGAYGFIQMSSPPANAYEIRVTSKMWSWSFRYPNGHIDNELHVPVDRPVRLVMKSDDVIHSLYVPAFRVKQDLIPGRYTKMWFEATKTGTFLLFCAEYCGQQHSDMITSAVVHPPGEFERWLDEASNLLKTLTPAKAGEVLFTRRGCAQCHSIDGSRRVGPSFYNLFDSMQRMSTGEELVVDENYIRESIIEPQAKVREGYRPVMPTYQGQLKDEELDALIEYIKTLK